MKNYTLERLSDIYRTWCLKKIGGLNVNHDYDWIPGRILRSFFDKDFGYVYVICYGFIFFWMELKYFLLQDYRFEL